MQSKKVVIMGCQGCGAKVETRRVILKRLPGKLPGRRIGHIMNFCPRCVTMVQEGRATAANKEKKR